MEMVMILEIVNFLSWRLSLRKSGAVVLVLAAVVLGPLQFGGQRAMASGTGHGIVPIGLTNEGGSGGGKQITGILDIVAAPCVGVATSEKAYEAIPSRITLLRGSKVIARWEIYGQQRIAWVEPVGTYFMHSNQSTVTTNVRVIVSSSRVATVNLIARCQ
jgi:hypothetical protein